MKQICSSCHYIGEIIKPRKLTYKFPLSGLLIGFGLDGLIKTFINQDLVNFKLLIEDAPISSLVVLIFSIYLLYNDLKSIKTRPPNKKSSRIFIIFSAILLVFGSIALFSVLLESNFTHLLSPLIWFSIGFLSVAYYLRASNHCPNCGKIETLIPINEDRAQKIIKENNLTIPDDPVVPLEEPKPKMPWESN